MSEYKETATKVFAIDLNLIKSKVKQSQINTNQVNFFDFIKTVFDHSVGKNKEINLNRS